VSARERATEKKPRGGLLARTNLLTSVVLVFPVFLVYQLGVLVAPGVGNGADLITSLLFRLRERSLPAYFAVHAVMVLGFFVLLVVLRGRQEFRLRMFLPVTLESAIYAVAMGAVILQVMSLVGIDPSLRVAAAAKSDLPGGLFARVALACGAGVHEELVFRLILLAALMGLLAHLAGMRRWIAIAVAFVISSLLFSAAHHVIGGEPWRIGVFVYRFFCGIVFAVLYQWRGFAVAVYTHTLYDVYVMVLG